jgi:alpha-L-fucosidase
LKALAAECRRQGIKLGLFYSILDWHHPDYLPHRKEDTRPSLNADFNRYLTYMKGQIRELLTQYGPIGVFYISGGWEGDAERFHSKELIQMIRALQPGIVINDLSNLPEDYHVMEDNVIPSEPLPNGRLWETCMTLGKSWGYHRYDHGWKSGKELTRNLIDS